MRTQIAIIGAGPAGLLLGQLLHKKGISNVIVEQRSSEYVLSRVGAGVIEQSAADLLDTADVGQRLRREGLVHEGIEISFVGERHRIDLRKLTGKAVIIYGQTEITRDLTEARAATGGSTIYEAENVTLHDIGSAHPKVTYRQGDADHEIECDFIAGCDGFHGVSRPMISDWAIQTYERIYPFGWLGILSDTPPVSPELIYVSSERGFALCSMRSKTSSRLYLQCRLDDRVEDWPDQRFWAELKFRLNGAAADTIATGPSIEKSIVFLRSFVAEPLRYGHLFLAGDAAHIAPPTGAKGLNLAASDVYYLSNALTEFYEEKSEAGLNAYSHRALARIWKSERFAWWMTTLLHQLQERSGFDQKLQQTELEYLFDSTAAQTALAENYVGLPY